MITRKKSLTVNVSVSISIKQFTLIRRWNSPRLLCKSYLLPVRYQSRRFGTINLRLFDKIDASSNSQQRFMDAIWFFTTNFTTPHSRIQHHSIETLMRLLRKLNLFYLRRVYRKLDCSHTRVIFLSSYLPPSCFMRRNQKKKYIFKRHHKE